MYNPTGLSSITASAEELVSHASLSLIPQAARYSKRVEYLVLIFTFQSTMFLWNGLQNQHNCILFKIFFLMIDYYFICSNMISQHAARTLILN